MEQWMDLGRIFNLEQWETVQNSLVDITEMAIITVDYKGRPKTRHSGCCEFCRKVREDEELSQYCQKCDARGGLEAVRTNKPYIYKCYFSIIDIAIPIIVKDQYIGAIMAGQIRVSPEDNESSMEQIYVAANRKYIEEKKQELLADYQNIPTLSYERIRVIARMLYSLCNYMVTEFIRKDQIIEKYEEVCRMNNVPDTVICNALSLNADDRKRLQSQSLKETVREKNGLLKHMDSSNPIILDVFTYISQHKDEAPSLSKMAEYCNVSTGYLSRLFSKEVGESYSSFTSRLKVEWAKALLETTDKTIYEISEELGFSEAGYFIKIFKKYVGLTPAAYRSYLRIP